MKKMVKKMVAELEFIDSIIGVVGVLSILCGALFIQFFYGEQPCPLCLLQRAAFINVGIGLLMNVRYGNKVSHWATAVFSSAIGLAVSVRQILLHITSPQGFGSTVLGLHMYTWCFIVFFITIVGSAVMLLIYPEKNST